MKWNCEIENKNLKEVLEIIQTVADECKLTVNQNGIYTKVVDPAHVCMAEVDVDKKMFESYNIKGEMEIGINLPKLEKLLNRIGSDTIVELEVNYEDREPVESELKSVDELGDENIKEALKELIEKDDNIHDLYNKYVEEEILPEEDDDDREIESVWDLHEGEARELFRRIKDEERTDLKTYDLRAEIREEVEYQTNHIEVWGERVHRKIPLVDIAGMTDPSLPKLDLANKVEVLSTYLKQGVKFANDIADHVALISEETGLKLSAVEDEDTVDYPIIEEDLERYDFETEVKSLFALDYMNSIVASIPDENIEVEMGADYPLKMKFSLDADEDGNSEIMYLLAPRIESA